jgi:hypothetical protein
VAVLHVWNTRSLERSVVAPLVGLACRVGILPPIEHRIQNRSYAPSELATFARRAGLIPLRVLGSRFMPHTPRGGDWLKRTVESGASLLAARAPVLYEFATDYVVALQRPHDRGGVA